VGKNFAIENFIEFFCRVSCRLEVQNPIQAKLKAPAGNTFNINPFSPFGMLKVKIFIEPTPNIEVEI
jgi:hypothetical protein